MSQLDINDKDGAVLLTVKVVPCSSRTVAAGTLGGMLRVKVSAPPEKGRANKCLVKYLSNILGSKKKSITIVSGSTSPVKQVRIEDMTRKEVLTKLDDGNLL